MQSPVQTQPLRLEVSPSRRSFEVVACERIEAVNQPYVYTLDIVHPSGELDLQGFLFSAAYLHGNHSIPSVHGHIQSIVRSTTGSSAGNLLYSAPSRYRVTLGPRLGLMAYRHNQRIFQGLSAEQIIRLVLGEHGIEPCGYRWEREQPCQERYYCAQYHESDLDLVQRLCEEEGMQYYFLQSRHHHVVVFTDRVPESVQGSAEVTPSSGERIAPVACIQRACVVGRLFERVSLNEQGRLKVRFDWSNQGDGARFNDCWITVDPALAQTHQTWWGGMEVMVSFRDDDPGQPYVSDRLWDPDINPHASSAPRRVITTRIDLSEFLDETRQFVVDDQFIMSMAHHGEMHFRVGSSDVIISSESVSLSGLQVMLSSIATVDDMGVNQR